MPVTQLQVEVHVYNIATSNQTHKRTHSYGKYGLWQRPQKLSEAPVLPPEKAEVRRAALAGIRPINGNYTNNPQSMMWDLSARKMLNVLYDAGCAHAKTPCR